jgi:hypothetical protein
MTHTQLQPDWFSLWSEHQGISASRGCNPCSSGFPTFKTPPGCAPDGTYYHRHYDESNGRGHLHRWTMPDPFNFHQFVGSNWSFGISDGVEGTDYRLFIKQSNRIGTPWKLYATRLYDANDRVADRGTVWDMNRLFLSGTAIEIRYRQWKGPNQNNNNFVVALIGEWIRDEVAP